MQSSKAFLEALLAPADIAIGGNRPWDVRVHDERLYDRVVSQATLGLGEAYMDGWWDVERLDEFFHKIFSAGLEKRMRINAATMLRYLRAKFFNMQRLRAFEVGERHYDIGNDLYKAMLDKRLAYTCGYWDGDPPTGGLNDAQEAKLDLICRKIGLQRGQRVLDIGSGWGSFILFAAERYGAQCTGITVSREQAAYANAMKKDLPANTLLQDYRATTGSFDHVVSVGMFEHVGYKNYRTYMEKAHSLLKNDGLFLLHTIGGNASVVRTDPWIEKYIFPNGMLPSAAQIAKSVEGLFVVEDWHNFGADYDTTLMCWHKNFNARWPELREKYGDRFHRMWNYYLLSSAGSFRARKNQLWQIVLSKKGVQGGYRPVR